jgi:hypothetical protein
MLVAGRERLKAGLLCGRARLSRPIRLLGRLVCTLVLPVFDHAAGLRHLLFGKLQL